MWVSGGVHQEAVATFEETLVGPLVPGIGIGSTIHALPLARRRLCARTVALWPVWPLTPVPGGD